MVGQTLNQMIQGKLILLSDIEGQAHHPVFDPEQSL
jgi:hypothetical protein